MQAEILRIASAIAEIVATARCGYRRMRPDLLTPLNMQSYEQGFDKAIIINKFVCNGELYFK